LKLSSWKDLAELIALLAVIGGLIAVVIELRQTQSALRAQAYQARALDVISTMRQYSDNPELAILLTDFFQGDLTIETASSEELSLLRSHFYMRRTDLDNEHYQYQNGFLDSDFYETTTKREIKAFAPHWRAFRIPEPRKQFAEEVDRILADPAVNPILH
jgi:hypothetical protein